jgi:hypothetical protein
MEAQRSMNFNEFLTNFKVQNEECHYYATHDAVQNVFASIVKDVRFHVLDE